MALIDDLKARFPEIDTSVIDAKFPLIEFEWHCYFNHEYGLDGCDDAAILLLCAHLIVMETKASKSAGSVRSVTSKSAGSVSLSYAEAQETGGRAQFFNTTTYGQRFLRLTSKYRIGALFV